MWCYPSLILLAGLSWGGMGEYDTKQQVPQRSLAGGTSTAYLDYWPGPRSAWEIEGLEHPQATNMVMMTR
jgi:hypothetical protein